MIKKKQFLSEIVKVAHSELLHLGFAKERIGYRCPVEEGVTGYLGLGTTVNEGPEKVGVYPTVGVVHERIEELVQEYRKNQDSRPSVTLTTNVGYVMPERKFLTWVFESRPFDWVHETKKMVRAVEVYGIPFMKSNAKLEAIIDDLSYHRYIDKDSAAYRLPVAYLLAGKTDLAKEYTKKYVEGLGDRNDPAAQLYRTFASNLLHEATLG